jgi:hypothetical protein
MASWGLIIRQNSCFGRRNKATDVPGSFKTKHLTIKIFLKDLGLSKQIKIKISGYSATRCC